jgi:uncharacterized membrane protein YfcA
VRCAVEDAWHLLPWRVPVDTAGLIGLAILVVVSLVSAVINTMAGGGGLLVLPVLVALGVPPAVANGTMRVGVVTQNITAIFAFRKHGFGDWRLVGRLLPAMIVGAVAGAWVATRLSNEVLRPVFGGVLLLWAVGLVVRPGRFIPAASEPTDPGVVAQLASVAIGFYGGFIQAGVGFPLMALLMTGLGHPAVRGNAIKVALVLGFTLVSLPVFIAAGDVAWREGLALAVGGAIGGWIGASWQSKSGAQVVRWFVIIAVAVSGAAMIIGW